MYICFKCLILFNIFLKDSQNLVINFKINSKQETNNLPLYIIKMFLLFLSNFYVIFI